MQCITIHANRHASVGKPTKKKQPNDKRGHQIDPQSVPPYTNAVPQNLEQLREVLPLWRRSIRVADMAVAGRPANNLNLRLPRLDLYWAVAIGF